MKRLFKSRKALSPVVAAIILIAVTVAVSIAVAAWMGALTFTFMQTEELKVLTHSWGTDSITLSVKNTGTADLSVNDVQVASVSQIANSTFTGGFSGTTNTLASGSATGIIQIDYVFSPGTKYEFAILTAQGNKFTYIATAP